MYRSLYKLLAASVLLLTSLQAKDNEKYDTITVHGMKLQGKVADFGPEKLSFKLAHCDGINYIAYKDIDSIKTAYSYHIIYHQQDFEGKIVGLKNKQSLAIQNNEGIYHFKISDINTIAHSVEKDNPKKPLFPHLSGNINLGLEQENSSNVKRNGKLLLNLKNKNAQNETIFYTSYEYETVRAKDNQNQDIAIKTNELTAYLIHSYYYDDNKFIFGSLVGDYDKPRKIDKRYAPAIGWGYNFQSDQNRWLSPMIGLAHVNTFYTDAIYKDQSYVAAMLGLKGEYLFENVPLFNRLILDGRLLYYPSFENFREEWVSRMYLNLTIPFGDIISMKLMYEWINDSFPDPNIGNNKTKFNIRQFKP